MSAKEETPGGNRGLESQKELATMTTCHSTPTPALADEGLDILCQVETRQEASALEERSWWVSVDPAIGSNRGTAQHWRVFINLTASAADDGDRVRVDRIDIITARAGIEALPEIDDALRAHGFVRSGKWQFGTGRGYVWWLTLDEEAVLS